MTLIMASHQHQLFCTTAARTHDPAREPSQISIEKQVSFPTNKYCNFGNEKVCDPDTMNSISFAPYLDADIT